MLTNTVVILQMKNLNSKRSATGEYTITEGGREKMQTALLKNTDTQETAPIHTTTLSMELHLMARAIEGKLRDYVPPKGEPLDVIMQIMKSHSRVENMAEAETERMRAAVSHALGTGAPIPIGFLWAVGGIVPSQVKFRQWELNYPRLGDIWGLNWLFLLGKKIQRVHEPGIRVVVVDELPMLRLLGWSDRELSDRHMMMQALAPRGVEIVRLPGFESFVLKNPVAEPTDEEIFATALCVPWPDPPSELLDMMYKVREKNWTTVRKLVPTERWAESRALRKEMSRIGQARKESGFMQTLFGSAPYIDGCITVKDRWCPRMWGNAFPQHGGTALEDHTRYGVTCLPEYQLEATHQPVMISTKEFDRLLGNAAGKKGQLYTFYWLKRR